MASLSISRAWEETKATNSADGRLMTIVAAALFLLPQALVTVIAPPEQLSGTAAPGWFFYVILLMAFVTLVGQLAIVDLAIRPRASVGEAMAAGARRFLPTIGAIFIFGAAMFLIAIPLLILFVGGSQLETAAEAGQSARSILTASLIIVVLAIIVGARFLLIVPIAASEQGSPVHILKRSWSLGRGHYFRFLAVTLLVAIAAIVITVALQFGGGAIIGLVLPMSPFSIGALLFGLIIGAVKAALTLAMTVLLARIYVQLAGGEAAPATVPTSGT